MIITLQLQSLALDFDAGISKQERERITQEQLELPVSFEARVNDYRECFDLDVLQDWATDEISNRSGLCVEDLAFC